MRILWEAQWTDGYTHTLGRGGPVQSTARPLLHICPSYLLGHFHPRGPPPYLPRGNSAAALPLAVNYPSLPRVPKGETSQPSSGPVAKAESFCGTSSRSKSVSRRVRSTANLICCCVLHRSTSVAHLHQAVVRPAVLSCLPRGSSRSVIHRAPRRAEMSDGNEFAELLWENGQAVVHGRRKQQPQAVFPPFTCGAASSSRAQEKQPGTDPVALLKTGGLFGDLSSGLDATRDNGDLDDTVPWIHYNIVEEEDAAPALAESYSPDFFSELHAAAVAAASTNLSALPPPVQQTGNNRSTPVATTSRGPEPSKETHRIPIPGPASRPEPQAEFAATRKQSGGEGLMNFSLFSRPAAMARASLQRPPQTGTDKASNVTTSTRVESTVLQSTSGPRTAPVFTDQRTPWSQSKEVRFSCAAAPTAGNLQQEMPRDMTQQKKVETRKASEVAVDTSSVCSGNGAGIGNDESWRQQKRKSQAECSASQDDDLDDESGGMRRSGSRGTKRSRTAEVHNLSERRRRDRINEKMRALQELIPNCNKIDKASMLDEAIEYLKTLQLQVQMMSMGSGLCIPPMLLPPTMQHLQIPPIAHFPHLGMGLGYGMGVLDMNSTAAVPFPPMPGVHFPCSMIPGTQPQGLGMPGRNTMPMFGVPGQAIHPSASNIQPFPSLAGLPVRPNLTPQVSAVMVNTVQEQQQGVATQQQQSLNNEAQQGANTGDPQLQTTMQAENQHFSVPYSAQTESNQFLDGGGNMNDTTGRNEAGT